MMKWLTNLFKRKSPPKTPPKFSCYSLTCPASFTTYEEREEHERSHERSQQSNKKKQARLKLAEFQLLLNQWEEKVKAFEREIEDAKKKC